MNTKFRRHHTAYKYVLGVNPGLRGGKPASNHLRYGTAINRKTILKRFLNYEDTTVCIGFTWLRTETSWQAFVNTVMNTGSHKGGEFLDVA
jgi:hypothetical protein